MGTINKDKAYWTEWRRSKDNQRAIVEYGTRVRFKSPPLALDRICTVLEAYQGKRSVLRNKIINGGDRLMVEFPHGWQEVTVGCHVSIYYVQDMNANVKVVDKIAHTLGEWHGKEVRVPLEGMNARWL